MASKLHIEGVVDFLREIQPLLNQPRPRGGDLAAPRATMPTEPEGEPTKRDLELRLRMSPLGRSLGRDAK